MIFRFVFFTIIFALATGCTDTAEVEFKITGKGYQGFDLKDLSIFCDSPSAHGQWSSYVKVKKYSNGYIKASSKLAVPKNVVIRCSFSGENLSRLPHIPIFNNGLRSEYFSIKGNADFKVILNRSNISIDNEVYNHLYFGKTDHIAKRNLKLQQKF